MKKTKRSDDENISVKQKKVKSTALTVNFTGIRDGEIIIGNNPNQTKGVEMMVKNTVPYYPIDRAGDELVRDQFKSVAYFSTMTFDERQAWISTNIKTYKAPGKENHLYDVQNDGLKVKFLKIECKHFTSKLGPSVIEMLLKGNVEDDEGYWPICQVYELFKPKDKVTKANRHNLVLRPENWELKRIVPKRVIFNGTLVLRIDGSVKVSHNREKKNVPIRKEEEIYSFCAPNGQEIGLIYNEKDSAILTRESLLDMARDYMKPDVYEECKEIIALIQDFTPSLYKSLMQKIVRTQSSFIVHDGKEYNALPFLLVTFILLALHPGSFNPNKQRFVSGLESATKRLAIIICEDSHVCDMSQVSLLLVDALIKQQDCAWMPPLAHFNVFFQLLLETLESPRQFIYKTDVEHKITTISPLDEKKLVPFKINYVLLKEIGSMHGDINFFSDLARGNHVITENGRKEILKMKLVHCVDQHCFTSIAHFIPYDEVKT